MNSALAFTLIPIIVDVIAVLGLYILANTGRLSVGHAAFFGIGAYAGAICSTRLGLHPAISMAIGAAIAGAVGLCFAAVADRLTHWFFAVTTLAFSVMVVSVVSGIDALGAATGIYGVPLWVELPQALMALVATIAFVIWLDASTFGRSMRAVRDNEFAAQALGIRPTRVRVIAFGIGTFIAGFAGGLYVHFLGLVKPSDMELARSLMFVVYLSIGGLEYWGGAVLGTVLLAALPEVLRFSKEYRLAMFGGLLTLFMLLRPAGLLSSPKPIHRFLQFVLQRFRSHPATAKEELLPTKGS